MVICNTDISGTFILKYLKAVKIYLHVFVKTVINIANSDLQRKVKEKCMSSVRRYSDSVLTEKGANRSWKWEIQNSADHFELNVPHTKSLFTSLKGSISHETILPDFYFKTNYISSASTTAKAESESPSCYSSTINEGFSNTEVVTDSNNKDDNVYKFDDDEIFTATPFSIKYKSQDDLISDYLSPFSVTLTSHHKPESSDLSETFDFEFGSKTSSESEPDIYLKLLSDFSSSDDEYVSSPSPKRQSLASGNLPHFDILDVSSKVEQTFKAPLNPLVSKRNPTATVTHLPEPSLVETRQETNPDLSDSQATGQQTKIVPSAETSTSQFCSTNVQSALLNKIVSRDDVGAGARNPLELNFIDFPIPVPSKRRKSASESNFSTKHKEDTEYNTKSKRKTHERDIATDLKNFESEVGKAFEESISEGSVLPLLKQELQCKIQVKRLSRGQSELFLEQEAPKTYELRPEEIQKKNMRLEQNRRSAQRARKKARTREKVLLKTIKTEMSVNARLQGEIDFLQRTKIKLKAVHDQHMKYCKRK